MAGLICLGWDSQIYTSESRNIWKFDSFQQKIEIKRFTRNLFGIPRIGFDNTSKAISEMFTNGKIILKQIRAAQQDFYMKTA